MAGKTDFTEQEWEQLHKGVTGAGLLVALSDRSFFDTFKEAGALAKHMANARQSSSQVVKELAASRGAGFGVVSTPDQVETETLEALWSAAAAVMPACVVATTRRTPQVGPLQPHRLLDWVDDAEPGADEGQRHHHECQRRQGHEQCESHRIDEPSGYVGAAQRRPRSDYSVQPRPEETAAPYAATSTPSATALFSSTFA